MAAKPAKTAKPRTATTLIDLDAIDNFPDLAIVIEGREHPLKPVSVDDFVANTKLLASLGKGGDIEEEMEGLKSIILRAFPTLDRETLGRVPLVNLNRLVGMAQENDGTNAVKNEVAESPAGKP